MKVRSPGLSGLAVAVAAAGGLMLYAGIRNLSVIDTLRSLTGPGVLPTQGSNAGSLGSIRTPLDEIVLVRNLPDTTGVAGGAAASAGSALADAVRKYLGVRYVFGGASPATGFDCSGLVTYALHHDLGFDLTQWRAGGVPCSNSHTVTGQFLITDGLVTVDKAQCRAGDLVCWSGHIGVAVSATRMIAAPHAGGVVKEENIWWSPPPLIRRLRSNASGKGL